MTNFKKLSLGLVAATMLVGHSCDGSRRLSGTRRAGLLLSELTVPHSRLRRESGASAGLLSSYYSGNRFQPAPRVGAFATAPWDDGSYGSYGLVERQW